MNHVELDDLIDRLDHDVNGFSFFEKKGDFWSEAWGRVKQISSSFKEVRYPTLKEKNEAWGRFQEVVETMKKDAERRRQERESRKEQRERDSMRALQQVLNEAGRAWPWPDGLVEAMKMLTGIKLAEVMFEFAEMVIDEIMGIKPKSEADRRRQELVECSRFTRNSSSLSALLACCSSLKIAQALSSSILTLFKKSKAWTRPSPVISPLR
jgi:hypothetical protein